MSLGSAAHLRHLTSTTSLAERVSALKLKNIICAPSGAGALERLSVTDDLPVPRDDGYKLPPECGGCLSGARLIRLYMCDGQLMLALRAVAAALSTAPCPHHLGDNNS